MISFIRGSSSKDVSIQEVNGDHIVVITVPRADRSYKPVYVDGNPVSGTYRRNGEGDYKCTGEELRAMYRDASVKTQDMLVLQDMGMDVFNSDSLRGYRQRMRLSRPGHVWDTLEDEEFLLKMGAAGIGEDGKKHPTAAGLLMFGNLLKETGLTDRLSDTAQNALTNIVIIFLGISVGAKAAADTFLTIRTIEIVVLGLIAFSFSTAGGLLLGKIMYRVTGGKVNPLIGSAGVSAVPMAARVSQIEGQKANPNNYLLMHAMGPNVAGVIGSAVAAGFMLKIFGA